MRNFLPQNELKLNPAHHHNSKRGPALLLALFIVSGFIGGFAFLKAKPRSWTLPDGSRLTLRKVTFGTNHVCRYGKAWQNLLEPILPQSWDRKVNLRVARLTTERPEIVVWFGQTPAASGGSGQRFGLAAFDAHGLTSAILTQANLTVSGSLRPTTTGWILADVPRQAKDIAVRIYSGDGLSLIAAEFSFPSRLGGCETSWTSESMPILKQTNQLAFTLIDLETGLAGDDDARLTLESQRTFSRARLRVEENGLPTGNWRVSRIIATSPSGLRHVYNYNSPMTTAARQPETSVVFPGALWPAEAAWKLRMDLSRCAEFPPAEIWGLRDVSVPATGQSIEELRSTNMFQAKLDFIGISAPSGRIPSRFARVKGCWNIHLRTPYPLEELDVVLLEVRTADGTQCMLKDMTSVPSDGGRGITLKEKLYSFGVNIPEGAKTVNVSFAITPVASVEFCARPGVVDQPSAKN